MSKLMKFENTPIDIQIINGVPMFELYSTGMALGQVKKNGKGTIYPARDRIDKNVENAEIQPCVRNAHKYITESQLYDLMLEARTDKCRAFRKWLTNEVLPELNHNGTYNLKKEPQQEKQLKLYEYFDKKWNGRSVMTVEDISHFTNIGKDSIKYCIKTYGKEGEDYYLLKRSELAKFKIENPKANGATKALFVISRSGFETICKWYGIKIDYPDGFLRDMFIKPKAIEPPKNNNQSSKTIKLTKEEEDELTESIIDDLMYLKHSSPKMNMKIKACAELIAIALSAL